jgi:hypothetical protein
MAGGLAELFDSLHAATRESRSTQAAAWRSGMYLVMIFQKKSNG